MFQLAQRFRKLAELIKGYKMGLGTVSVKHNAYLYIKPIANGVVVECGNQIVGDEAVFYSGNNEDTRRIVNAYLDVLFNGVVERPTASVKKAMQASLLL